MEPISLVAIAIAIVIGGGGVVYALYRGGYFKNSGR